MDLKFTFPGGASDRDHEAPAGTALPLATNPGGMHGEVTLEVRRVGGAVRAEALSGDGVSYAQTEVPLVENGPDPLTRAVRSAVSRVVAELADPLVDAVAVLDLDLAGDEPEVFAAFGIDPADPAVSEALQRRTGVSTGTPIRVAA